MKIAVVGSRNFKDFSLLKSTLNQFENISCIVSGGAIGADRLAEKYASLYNISTEIFLPNYAKFGRKAPIIRNAQIVRACDIVVAFWDGHSRGTLNAIHSAKLHNKKLNIIFYERC